MIRFALVLALFGASTAQAQLGVQASGSAAMAPGAAVAGAAIAAQQAAQAQAFLRAISHSSLLPSIVRASELPPEDVFAQEALAPVVRVMASLPPNPTPGQALAAIRLDIAERVEILAEAVARPGYAPHTLAAAAGELRRLLPAAVVFESPSLTRLRSSLARALQASGERAVALAQRGQASLSDARRDAELLSASDGMGAVAGAPGPVKDGARLAPAKRGAASAAPAAVERAAQAAPPGRHDSARDARGRLSWLLRNYVPMQVVGFAGGVAVQSLQRAASLSLVEAALVGVALPLALAGATWKLRPRGAPGSGALYAAALVVAAAAGAVGSLTSPIAITLAVASALAGAVSFAGWNATISAEAAFSGAVFPILAALAGFIAATQSAAVAALLLALMAAYSWLWALRNGNPAASPGTPKPVASAGASIGEMAAANRQSTERLGLALPLLEVLEPLEAAQLLLDIRTAEGDANPIAPGTRAIIRGALADARPAYVVDRELKRAFGIPAGRMLSELREKLWAASAADPELAALMSEI